MERPNPVLDSLVDQLIRHLDEEERQLQEVFQRTLQVRSALLARDTSQLHQASECLSLERTRKRELGKHRDALRGQIARQIRKPLDQVTLSAIAKSVEGTIRQRLLHQRKSLRHLLGQIERTSRANLSFIRQFGHVLQMTMEMVTGKSSTDRYTQEGRLASPGHPSIFQTDC